MYTFKNILILKNQFLLLNLFYKDRKKQKLYLELIKKE